MEALGRIFQLQGVEICCLASLWGKGLISPLFCLLMTPYFFVGPTQIIYAFYGVYSYNLKLVSSLKTNLAKSELVPVGNVDNVAGSAGILGCGVAFLPLTYPGLPMGASYLTKHIWDGVIKKMEHWSANWKMKYLSKSGRITLSRTPYPTYLSTSCHYFFSLRVLQTVLRSSNVISYWAKVKSSNTTWLDGPRFVHQSLRESCRSLLGKWLLRCVLEREAWWRVVVDSKYGSA
jgi:hypothetical protein